MKIPFNRPAVTGREPEALAALFAAGKFSGDGPATKRCHEILKTGLGCASALLTTSCTHALEMAAHLLDLSPGEEVIMPSFTFVSTANAFVLRGAVPVFVDIDPATMNLDPACVAKAINSRTRAIVPVHYGGVGCAMDELLTLAEEHGLAVVEDAAQAYGATYRGRPLGTFGALGALSFHETKNIHCGEGGALIVNDPMLAVRAETIREKGTNRSRFFRGEVDKYTWVDIGSSYLPSELNAAFLEVQLLEAGRINAERLTIWNAYFEALAPLRDAGHVELPFIPPDCLHNGHVFYLKAKDLDERTRLIEHLKRQGIGAPFHYVPLHSSPAGMKNGRFAGIDRFTTRESDRLVRLPLFLGLTNEEQAFVVRQLFAFWGVR